MVKRGQRQWMELQRAGEVEAAGSGAERCGARLGKAAACGASAEGGATPARHKEEKQRRPRAPGGLLMGLRQRAAGGGAGWLRRPTSLLQDEMAMAGKLLFSLKK